MLQEGLPENPPPYSEIYLDQLSQEATPGIATVSPPTVTSNQAGPKPTKLVCKSCNKETITKVKSTATTRTHTVAFILCLGKCWPCVCVPYLMNSCNNVDHYCPECGCFIGTYIN